MRLVAIGVKHIFISQRNRAKHLRLQHEQDEILCLSALDAALALTVLLLGVESAVETISLNGHERIRHRTLPVVAAFHYEQQDVLLFIIQFVCVCTLGHLCNNPFSRTLYHTGIQPHFRPTSRRKFFASAF